MFYESEINLSNLVRVGASLEVDPAVRVRRERLRVFGRVPRWLWPVCSIRKRKKRMILCQSATAAALPPSGGGDEVGAVPGGEGCCHPTTRVGLRDHCRPLHTLFHMLSERCSFGNVIFCTRALAPSAPEQLDWVWRRNKILASDICRLPFHAHS